MISKFTTTLDKEGVGLGLKMTIFSLMLAGSIIPLGLYAGFSYGNINEQINEEFSARLTGDNQNNSEAIQSWINGHESTVRALAVSSELGTMDANVVRDYMVKVNAELPAFYALVVIGTDGVQIARSNIDKLINVGDRPYFKNSMAGMPSSIQSIISRTNGKTFFTVAAPIRNSSKEIVGVLSAMADSGPITEKITTAKIGKTGFSYLVDHEGAVLSHTDANKIGTKVPQNVRPLLAIDYHGRVSDLYTLENTQVKVTSSSAGNGLVLVSQIDRMETLLPLKQAQTSMVYFVLSTIGLMGLFSWLLASSLTSKINLLSSIAGRISKARTEADLAGMEKQIDSVGGAREFRLLGSSIKRLGNSIRMGMRTTVPEPVNKV